MKKRIRYLPILFAFSIFITTSFSAAAYEKREAHNDDLEHSLFLLYEHDLKEDQKTKDAIKALEYAAYLTIDQANSNGETELKFLKEYGVKDLPASVSELGKNVFGGEHRRHTHIGWEDKNYISSEDLKYWKIRKKILINTVDEIFDLDGKEKKKESFCALVYYIHILGDRYDDCQKGKRTPPAEVMEIGGKSYDKSIISELKTHLATLFSNQKHTSNYQHMISELNDIESKLQTVNFSSLTDKDNTSDDFLLYKKCVERTLSLFTATTHSPQEQFAMLLKGEHFFNKVFYKHEY